MLGAQPPVNYKIKYCDKLIFEYKILNSRYSTLMSTNQRLCKNHQKHQELRDRSIRNKEFIHPSRLKPGGGVIVLNISNNKLNLNKE